MNTVLLLVGLLSGVLTLGFMLLGLRQFRAGGSNGARTIVITSLLSLLTGILTIWQLVEVLQSFRINW
jgi:hypothetical protein